VLYPAELRGRADKSKALLHPAGVEPTTYRFGGAVALATELRGRSRDEKCTGALPVPTTSAHHPLAQREAYHAG
jgi:hypothetical protein